MTSAEKLLARLDRAIAGRVAKAYGKVPENQNTARAIHAMRNNAGRVNPSYGSGYRKRLKNIERFTSKAGNNVENMRFEPGMFYARFTKKGNIEPVEAGEKVSMVPYVQQGEDGGYVMTTEYNEPITPQEYRALKAKGEPIRVKKVPLTYNDTLLRDMFSDPPGLPIDEKLKMVQVTNRKGEPVFEKGDDGRPDPSRPVMKPARGPHGEWLRETVDGTPDGAPIKLPRKKGLQTYNVNPNASKTPYNSPGLVKDALRIRELLSNGATLQEAMDIDVAHVKAQKEDREHRAWINRVARILSAIDEEAIANGGKGVLDRKGMGWLDRYEAGEGGMPRFLLDEYKEGSAYLTPGVSRRRDAERYDRETGEYKEGRWDPDKAEFIERFSESTPLDSYHMGLLKDRIGETYRHDRDQGAVDRRKDIRLDKELDRMDAAVDRANPLAYTEEQEIQLDKINRQLQQLAIALKADPENADYRKAVKILRAKQDEIVSVAAAAQEFDEANRSEYDRKRIADVEGKAVSDYNEAKQRIEAIPDAYDDMDVEDVKNDFIPQLKENHPEVWGQLDEEHEDDIARLIAVMSPEARESFLDTGVIGLSKPQERRVKGSMNAATAYRSRMLNESYDSRMAAAREFNAENDAVHAKRLMRMLGLTDSGERIDTGGVSENGEPVLAEQDSDALEWLKENGYEMPKDLDEAAMYLLDYKGNVERLREKELEFRYGQSADNAVSRVRNRILDYAARKHPEWGAEPKHIMDQLEALHKQVLASKAGRISLTPKEIFRERGLTNSEGFRFLEMYRFLQKVDPENPDSWVYKRNMKALGRDASGRWGDESETPVPEAIRNWYGNDPRFRDTYLGDDWDDESLQYIEYRKGLEKEFIRQVRTLADLSRNINPEKNSELKQLEMHLRGLSGAFFTDPEKFLGKESNTGNRVYAGMLDILNSMKEARVRANGFIAQGDSGKGWEANTRSARDAIEAASLKANDAFNDLDLEPESGIDGSIGHEFGDVVGEVRHEIPTDRNGDPKYEVTGYELIPKTIYSKGKVSQDQRGAAGQTQEKLDELYGDRPRVDAEGPRTFRPGTPMETDDISEEKARAVARGEDVSRTPEVPKDDHVKNVKGARRSLPVEEGGPLANGKRFLVNGDVPVDRGQIIGPAPEEQTPITGHLGDGEEVNEDEVTDQEDKRTPEQKAKDAFMGASVFDNAKKVKENRDNLVTPEALGDNKKASTGGEGLNTPDTIAKDMDDDLDFAEMSIGDMMNYIEKKGGKDGHPYGLPVQGSVFAYGSIRNTMGQGKEPSFQGVKAADSKVDGLTVKKVDVGRVEPSDTGSA